MLSKVFGFIRAERRRLVVFLVSVSFLCALDLVVKAWAESRLIEKLPSASALESTEKAPKKPFRYRRRDIVVVENFWTFSYVQNHDVGFSILSWTERWLSPKTKRVMIKSLQSLAILVALAYFFSSRMHYFVPFILIVGGGLGNVVDRLYRGYVVDYIKWSFPQIPIQILNPWPVFNLSDAFVSVGIVLLLAQALLLRRPNPLRL